MKEHIIVFDDPPQFGKGIPSLYNVQIIDVPKNEYGKVVTLLKGLGFASIREVEKGEGNNYVIKDGHLDQQPCIIAEYFVGGLKAQYDYFWNKKEKIELILDSL